ncbi:hypothetical protein BSLA_01f2944 [Burkholderia stabilis]|nr:hypothetical protein BSLA_01f2944 [Burkholderia stabilis]
MGLLRDDALPAFSTPNKNGAPEAERRDASKAGRQAGLPRYRMSDA